MYQISIDAIKGATAFKSANSIENSCKTAFYRNSGEKIPNKSETDHKIPVGVIRGRKKPISRKRGVKMFGLKINTCLPYFGIYKEIKHGKTTQFFPVLIR